MSSNKDKTRTTKNSLRVKTLAEQQQVYEDVLAKSLEGNLDPKDSGNPVMVAGSSQEGDEKNPSDQSTPGSEAVDDVPNHVDKPAGHSSGVDKPPLVDSSKKRRIHDISSEHDSSESQEDEPPKIKIPKKGDPSLIKKRKVLKPKGKSKVSAAAGSEAQLNQPQVPFVNPNIMQNSGFQQNQDPFAMMANLSRWMFNTQMGQGNFLNLGPMGMGPQNVNTPFIAQDDDSSEEEESEEGEDLTSDQEVFTQKTVNNSQSNETPPAQNQGGKFEQECEEECKVVLQEDDAETGPDAPEKLVNMIKNFIGRNKKQANVDELLLKYPRPKNMPFLKSPKIETDLFPKLAKYIKSFDGGCRLLQQYINAAITALVGAMTIILKREKLHEDLSQAGSLVKNAVKLLAYTNKDINCRRKDALRNTVNADCLPLLKHNRPSSEDWLLGQNLSESIKELEESKKLSEKVLKPKKDFPQSAQQQNYKGKRFRYKKGGKKTRYAQGRQDGSQGGHAHYQQNIPSQWQGFQSVGLSQPFRNQQQAQHVQSQAQYFQNQNQNWKQQGYNNFQYNNNNNNNNNKRKN